MATERDFLLGREPSQPEVGAVPEVVRAQGGEVCMLRMGSWVHRMHAYAG